MRKHMTNGEMIRIRKMLAAGVTDMAQIQAVVPIHSDCIQNVAAIFIEAQQAEAAKKTAVKKKAAKKVAAKIDPIS